MSKTSELVFQKIFRESGGMTALATAVGVTKQNVDGWRKRGQIPAERCLAVERACEGKVKRHEIRPDVFDAPATDVEPVASPRGASDWYS